MGKQIRARQRCVRDPGVRHFRLEHLLREELNSVFDSEIGDGSLANVRVSRVELSRDGSRARAWFEPPVAADIHVISAALRRASGFLRRRLSEALPLKRSPELRFCASAAACSEPSQQPEEP
jgi:ribosome-binding factor A